MSFIDNQYLNRWEDFVDIFKGYNPNDKTFMFRGHSNAILNENFQKWDLVSSFNRNNKRLTNYSFRDFLFQHFEDNLFQTYYGEYSFREIKNLVSAPLLEKCYYFQHYSIPTCFIDFTFHPLIALYFALTNLDGRSGGQYDSDGNPQFYSDDADKDYISVYKIDVVSFQKVFNIKNITKENFNIFNLDQFLVAPKSKSPISTFVGLDLDPLNQTENMIHNYNLTHQHGCFLYFDNENINMSLEKFLEVYEVIDQLKLSNPVITVYNINYNSLYKKMHSRNPNHIPVFRFLKQQKLTGQYLFDDIQGLKYDFNFFHQQ